MKSINFALLIMLLFSSGMNAYGSTGGTELENDEDWQAVGVLFEGSSPVCTATLISPRLVLTASHCLGKLDTLRNGDLWRNNLTYGVTDKNGAIMEQASSIAYAHPNYILNGSASCDVAVLELKHTYKPSEINPISLESGFLDLFPTIYPIGDTGYLVTHGPTEANCSDEDWLRRFNHGANSYSENNDFFFINKSADGGRWCGGDSGSPCFFQPADYAWPERSGIVGVAKMGMGSGEELKRVSCVKTQKHFSWIMSGTIPIYKNLDENGFVRQGEWVHYKFEPGAARGFSQFYARLFNISGDIEFYFSIGSAAASTDYYQKYAISAGEKKRYYFYVPPEEQTWYLSIYGKQGSEYSLRIEEGNIGSTTVRPLTPAYLSGSELKIYTSNREVQKFKIETRRLDTHVRVSIKSRFPSNLRIRRGMETSSASEFNDCELSTGYGGEIINNDNIVSMGYSKSGTCMIKNPSNTTTTWYFTVAGGLPITDHVIVSLEAGNDTDDDGFFDTEDLCPNDPNKIESGVCGCGVPDDDSDNDEVPDCSDYCPNDPNKIESGVCGCGFNETDTDGDEIPDCQDVDVDGDGIDDTIEDAGPFQGDGNHDGIPDRLQGNVGSLKLIDSDEYCTLESTTGTNLGQCKSLKNPSQEQPPGNFNFVFGFLEFKISNLPETGEAQLKVYLPEGFEPKSYYKYGKTTDRPEDHWYEFMYDGETGAQIQSNVITLHFRDGKRGDDVQAVDGAIIDLGGPGFSELVDTSSSSNNPANSNGESSGCFIDSIIDR